MRNDAINNVRQIRNASTPDPDSDFPTVRYVLEGEILDGVSRTFVDLVDRYWIRLPNLFDDSKIWELTVTTR